MGAARGEGPRARCGEEEEERPHGLFMGAAMALSLCTGAAMACLLFSAAVCSVASSADNVRAALVNEHKGFTMMNQRVEKSISSFQVCG